MGTLGEGTYNHVAQKGRQIWAANTQTFIVSLIFFFPSERIECKIYKHNFLSRLTGFVKMER